MNRGFSPRFSKKFTRSLPQKSCFWDFGIPLKVDISWVSPGYIKEISSARVHILGKHTFRKKMGVAIQRFFFRLLIYLIYTYLQSHVTRFLTLLQRAPRHLGYSPLSEWDPRNIRKKLVGCHFLSVPT